MNSYKQKKLSEFDEIMKNLPVNTSELYFEGLTGEKIETARMATVKQFISSLIDETKKEAQSEFEKILKEKEAHYEMREKLIIQEIKKEIREWMNRQDFPDIAWKIKLENLLNKIK
jgi:hypothetical protein